MYENVSAQNAIVNNDKSEQEVETKLIVAPTSHDIVAPKAMFGLEGLEREDITLPRIKLTQAMSEEVSNGSVSPGVWLNTLSGQNYGSDFSFTPISVWKSRTFFSENRDETPICRSADSFVSINGFQCLLECPHDKAWDWKDGVPPLCTLGYNYLVIPLVDPFPAIVTLMKSSFKAGKALNTLLIAARCPAWFWIYELYAVKESNPKGTFYVAAVRKKIDDGKSVASDEEMRQLAEHFYYMAKAGKVNVDEGSEGEVGGDVPF